jgi:hypothetical protein
MILQKIQEAILHCPECLNSERKQVVKMSECPGVPSSLGYCFAKPVGSGPVADDQCFPLTQSNSR